MPMNRRRSAARCTWASAWIDLLCGTRCISLVRSRVRRKAKRTPQAVKAERTAPGRSTQAMNCRESPTATPIESRAPRSPALKTMSRETQSDRNSANRFTSSAGVAESASVPLKPEDGRAAPFLNRSPFFQKLSSERDNDCLTASNDRRRIGRRSPAASTSVSIDGMDSPACLRHIGALVFIGVGIRSSSNERSPT